MALHDDFALMFVLYTVWSYRNSVTGQCNVLHVQMNVTRAGITGGSVLPNSIYLLYCL